MDCREPGKCAVELAAILKQRPHERDLIVSSMTPLQIAAVTGQLATVERRQNVPIPRPLMTTWTNRLALRGPWGEPLVRKPHAKRRAFRLTSQTWSVKPRCST